ncbi:hypothetical protein CEE36_06625 [candidate division TA06 bacterium B3_TA06]|uniref:Uncharacterized protein n=1 Tax=candidate division TA06 bacterium B3_TA06 TaxID=2012487 RepID=A0A532V6C4_UNCT6|nr:MAG: hypothetical protein CEE36_06625 [candidate division TA06 bacterium B3_TA06]
MKTNRLFSIAALALLSLAGFAQEAVTHEQHYRLRRAIAKKEVMHMAWIYAGGKRCQPGWSRTYQKEALTRVKLVCKEEGVRFRDFNHAHQQYSRLGLTYTQALRFYADTIGHYDRRCILEGKGLWWFIEDWDEWIDLLIDLGFLEGLLVEWDAEGRMRVEDFPMPRERVLAELEELMNEDPWEAVRLIVDPEVKAGEVFAFIKDAPYIRRMNIADPHLHPSIYVRIWPNMWSVKCLEKLNPPPPPQPPKEESVEPPHASDTIQDSSISFSEDDLLEIVEYEESLPPKVSTKRHFPTAEDSIRYERLLDLFDPNYPSLAAYVKIDNQGTIFLDSEPVLSQDELGRWIEKLVDFGPSIREREVLIACEDSVPWGKVVELARISQDSHADRICIVPASLLEGREPQLSLDGFMEYLQPLQKN